MKINITKWYVTDEETGNGMVKIPQEEVDIILKKQGWDINTRLEIVAFGKNWYLQQAEDEETGRKTLRVIDDYLLQDDMDALNNLHIEYAKVHWIGAESDPDTNALTKLVHSTKQYLDDPALGATAWYNVRPVDPVWHNDILSYNNKYPADNLPESTFIYYMRAPDSGGHLEFGGPGEIEDWKIEKTIDPIPNRLVYFDACMTHRVAPYEGNRVSIGMVWWKITPDRYEEQKIDAYNVLERVWT